jgi:hypothetical protein
VSPLSLRKARNKGSTKQGFYNKTRHSFVLRTFVTAKML